MIDPDQVEPSPHVEKPSRAGMDCVSALIFGGLLLWIVLVTWLRTGIEYFMSSSPSLLTPSGAFSLSLGAALLVGLPVTLAALFWPNQRYRAAFQTWALAALWMVFVLPVRLAAPTASVIQAFWHAGVAILLGIIILWLSTRRRPDSQEDNRRSGVAVHRLALTALLIGGLSSIPWLLYGALGSPGDLLVQGTAALCLGISAGLLLDKVLLNGIRLYPAIAWQDFLFGGLSAGGALLILACGTGFGYGGMQLLMMFVLPVAAWAAVGLALAGYPSRAAWLSPAILISLTLGAPMILVDANELPLFISASTGEIMGWCLQAASQSVMVLLGAGLLLLLYTLVRRSPTIVAAQDYALSNRSLVSRLPSVILAIAVLLVGIVAAVLYQYQGKPGFYGERWFVILRSQADLSPAAALRDSLERRSLVYKLLVKHAESTQANLRRDLDRMNIPYTPYYLVNGLEVQGDFWLRLWLATRPEVEEVLDSPHMRPLSEPPPANIGDLSMPTDPQWNLVNIGAPRVWKELGVTGVGIIIGQSDSGVQGDHPELAQAYRGRNGQQDYNWYDPWNHTKAPVDVGGHGTHTLGSILGKNTGVAPGANWYACVNLARNLGNPAFYLDCMQFMLAPFPQDGDPFKDGDPARGADIMNNSWGCPENEGCQANTFLPAVQALRTAGVFVVVSAGNDGPACASLKYPMALYREVFSVGAIDEAGQLAYFSSIGPVTVDGSQRVKPDIVAPGVEVLSAMPGNTYGKMSGTSMAGPHVAGVVALMWSANPALIGNIELSEQILRQTAQPYQGNLPNCPAADQTPSAAVGYGMVDAYAAVKSALQAHP